MFGIGFVKKYKEEIVRLEKDNMVLNNENDQVVADNKKLVETNQYILKEKFNYESIITINDLNHSVHNNEIIPMVIMAENKEIYLKLPITEAQKLGGIKLENENLKKEIIDLRDKISNLIDEKFELSIKLDKIKECKNELERFLESADCQTILEKDIIETLSKIIKK